MCVITQWYRKRRAQRQLLEERKKQEAERQAQREQQDYDYGQALRRMRQDLEGAMDPLIASQAYNNRLCPLTRLPEELLLDVLNFLRGDDVTLHCLRSTSRTFLRLLHKQSGFWAMHKGAGCMSSMEFDEIWQLRRLLQRDGRCENCRSWNARQEYFANPCKFKESCLRERPFFPGSEGMGTAYGGRGYCSTCETHHDVCQFPMVYKSLPLQLTGPWICLGQLGSVKLCEHVFITWAAIKAHIDEWRQQDGEGGMSAGNGWQACLESFSIECHDSTHDIRCTDSEPPTWPRARLGTNGYFREEAHDYVVLYLEWTPHGRVDSLKPTTDGQIPAAELRALFRKFRRVGPADTLYPPGFPETLPEMACFRSSFPVHYNMGEEEDVRSGPSPSPLSQSPPPWNHDQLWYHCQPSFGPSSIGWNSRKLDISPHYLSGASGHGITSQCLAVRYQKGIMICETAALTDAVVKLVPSDPWLHAMDVQTYPHQQARQFRPRCTDASCTNYYQRPKNHPACRPYFDYSHG